MVVDPQTELLEILSPTRREEFSQQLRRLIALTSDAYKIPTIIIGNDNNGERHFYDAEQLSDPTLREEIIKLYGFNNMGLRPGDSLKTKAHISAFDDSELADQLKARNITGIIVVGGNTGACVHCTVLDGCKSGFNCVALTDHMADFCEPEGSDNRWHQDRFNLTYRLLQEDAGKLHIMTLPEMIAELDKPRALRPQPAQTILRGAANLQS